MVKTDVVSIQKSTGLFVVVALYTPKACSSYILDPQPSLNHPPTILQPYSSFTKTT